MSRNKTFDVNSAKTIFSKNKFMNEKNKKN